MNLATFASVFLFFTTAAAAVQPITISQTQPAPQTADCAAIQKFLSASELCWDLEAGETLLAVTATYVVDHETIPLPSGYDLKEVFPAQAVLQQLQTPTALPQGATLAVISQQVRPVESHEGQVNLQAVTLLQISTPQGGKIVGKLPELQLPVNLCAKQERSSGFGLLDLVGVRIRSCEGDYRQEIPLSATSVAVEQVSHTAPPAKNQS